MLNSQGTGHFDRVIYQALAQTHQPCSNEQDLKYTVSFGKFEEQMPVPEQLLELATANQMKTEALEKASQMITLLEEQREDFKKQISQLKQQLYNKKVKIQYLEQKIQAITHNNHPSAIQTSMKSSFPGSKIEALTGSKLFFSFSQPQKQNPETCICTPPTFELDQDLLISQEMPLWQQPQGVIAQLKQAISRQSSSEGVLRQIETLVESEHMESQMLRWQLDQKIGHIQDCIEYDFSFSSRGQEKSSSTETQRQADSTQLSILQQYQNIILNYKAYTARLKAYLCEAINFMAQFAHTFPTALPPEIANISNISYFLSSLLLNYRQSNIQKKQLESIIEGLIQNLKFLRNEYYNID